MSACRAELLFVSRRGGRVPPSAFQAVVGSSKFKFSYYITGILILIGVLLGRASSAGSSALRVVSGAAA